MVKCLIVQLIRLGELPDILCLKYKVYNLEDVYLVPIEHYWLKKIGHDDRAAPCEWFPLQHSIYENFKLSRLLVENQHNSTQPFLTSLGACYHSRNGRSLDCDSHTELVYSSSVYT